MEAILDALPKGFQTDGFDDAVKQVREAQDRYLALKRAGEESGITGGCRNCER
jgi:hypothetical protein